MITIVYFLTNSINPYWYDKRIHNFGNSGLCGNLHALVSPLATKIIDVTAYKKVNVRKEIYSKFDGKIVDVCCGTGYSTKPGATGIDTSIEMLRFANIYNPGRNYLYGNAENFGNDKEFDLATCMFAFHEMPEEGHNKIVRNLMRISKKIVIVDISTNYKPSKAMLTGEPYISNYIDYIDLLLYNYGFNKRTYLDNHVDIWEINC